MCRRDRWPRSSQEHFSSNSSSWRRNSRNATKLWDVFKFSGLFLILSCSMVERMLSGGGRKTVSGHIS